ncbi:hypothetical protein CDD83_2737 [Cordyceps sp. RAO-2017]|nr:hypothetical protein CDD83_2737 [Cordyceps sp. RAO-2017]
MHLFFFPPRPLLCAGSDDGTSTRAPKSRSARGKSVELRRRRAQDMRRQTDEHAASFAAVSPPPTARICKGGPVADAALCCASQTPPPPPFQPQSRQALSGEKELLLSRRRNPGRDRASKKNQGLASLIFCFFFFPDVSLLDRPRSRPAIGSRAPLHLGWAADDIPFCPFRPVPPAGNGRPLAKPSRGEGTGEGGKSGSVTAAPALLSRSRAWPLSPCSVTRLGLLRRRPEMQMLPSSPDPAPHPAPEPATVRLASAHGPERQPVTSSPAPPRFFLHIYGRARRPGKKIET